MVVQESVFQSLLDQRVSRTYIDVQHLKVYNNYVNEKPFGWSGRKNDDPTPKRSGSSAKVS